LSSKLTLPAKKLTKKRSALPRKQPRILRKATTLLPARFFSCQFPLIYNWWGPEVNQTHSCQKCGSIIHTLHTPVKGNITLIGIFLDLCPTVPQLRQQRFVLFYRKDRAQVPEILLKQFVRLDAFDLLDDHALARVRLRGIHVLDACETNDC